MQVVLGPGWPGVLLHEAVGHGLEGDFNRKETSAFAGLVGEQCRFQGRDRGGRRHHEPTAAAPSPSTTKAPRPRPPRLIEDGILVGYMQDRQNARLMGMQPPPATGGARSYAHIPMPRMTNTFMLAGDHEPGRDPGLGQGSGLYAVSFGGGQVDITSGKFVFSCTEAYLIEDGKAGPCRSKARC